MHFVTKFFFSENDFFKPTHPAKVWKIPHFFWNLPYALWIWYKAVFCKVCIQMYPNYHFSISISFWMALLVKGVPKKCPFFTTYANYLGEVSKFCCVNLKVLFWWFDKKVLSFILPHKMNLKKVINCSHLELRNGHFWSVLGLRLKLLTYSKLPHL